MKTPRKIYLAVYCDSDEQAVAVQNVAKEFSSMFAIDAVDLLAIYPKIKDKRGLLKETAQVITKEGKKGAIRLIPALIKELI
jgi:hypothetical protein